MNHRISIHLVVTALLLITACSAFAQPAPANPGGPGGRGGRGGPFARALPPDQQALVDRIQRELAEEAKAVAAASSNLVAASFLVPKDAGKITEASNALAKARETWATKASRLVAQIQASDTKLSEEAMARLVSDASGRSGRGGPGRGLRGPGRPAGEPRQD
jgi:hypothetical protein